MQFHNQGESITPAHFRNVSGLLLAFVVLSTLAHGLSLLFSATPVVQLSEHRFGAIVISTVLASEKDQPAAQPSRKTIPFPQTKKPATDGSQFEQSGEFKTQSTVAILTSPSKSEFITDPTADSETPSKKGIESLPPQHLSDAPRQSEPVTTSTLANNIAPLTSEQVASQLEQQRNYLLGELQSRLNRYLSYPVLARRRGWQGEVMIAFDINVGGQLNNVRLAQTSGYSVLDRSAVNAINKLEKIYLPDTLGRLQAMELKLPVRYQLHEG